MPASHSKFLDSLEADGITVSEYPLGDTSETIVTRSLPTPPNGSPTAVIKVKNEVKLTPNQTRNLLMEFMALAQACISTGHQAHIFGGIFEKYGIKIDPQELINKSGWSVVIDATNVKLVIQTRKKDAADGSPDGLPDAAVSGASAAITKGRKISKAEPELRLRSKIPNVIYNNMTDEQALVLVDFFFDRNQIIRKDPMLIRNGWLANEKYMSLASPSMTADKTLEQIAQAANVKQFLANCIYPILSAELSAPFRTGKPLDKEHWTKFTNGKNKEGFSPDKPLIVQRITAAMLFCPQRATDAANNPPTAAKKAWHVHPSFYHLSKHKAFKNSDMIVQIKELLNRKQAQDEQKKKAALESKLPDTGAPPEEEEEDEEEEPAAKTIEFPAVADDSEGEEDDDAEALKAQFNKRATPAAVAAAMGASDDAADSDDDDKLSVDGDGDSSDDETSSTLKRSAASLRGDIKPKKPKNVLYTSPAKGKGGKEKIMLSGF